MSVTIKPNAPYHSMYFGAPPWTPRSIMSKSRTRFNAAMMTTKRLKPIPTTPLPLIAGFFHIQVPAINGSGVVGIGFSLFVVIIAALNLVLDFDMIERGVQGGAPKYMEWYGAFGLMVTLIWLYLEILRLLGKMRRR